MNNAATSGLKRGVPVFGTVATASDGWLPSCTPRALYGLITGNHGVISTGSWGSESESRMRQAFVD